MPPNHSSLSARLVARFAALFTGLGRAYGQYTLPEPGQNREDGKIEGRARTVFGAVTTDLYAAHLAGEAGLGIAPIQEDSTCVFGAIDIDVYADLDHAAIAAGLKELGLPLIPCRSKSGGCHIYLFASEPVPAARLQAYLRDVAVAIGHGTAEIFPKQTYIGSDPQSSANWINLAYFGGDTRRFAYGPDGRPLSLEEFLDYAEASRVPLARLSKQVSVAPDFEDGPPCLQALAASGGCSTGNRNKALFAMGVFLRKAKPGEYGALLEDFNQRYIHPAILSEELVQIKKSVGKKAYGYSCSEEPLVSRCNAAVCRFRKYGVGGDSTPMPQFGALKKLETVPPSYVWEINGKLVPLAPDEIITYKSFRRAVFMSVDTLLPLMKEAKWSEFVSEALTTMERVPMPEDAGPDGQLWEYVKQFANGRVQAFTLDEVLMGKPYRGDGFFYLRIADVVQHLGRARFKAPPVQEIAASLRRHGGEHLSKKLRGQSVNLWVFSENVLLPSDVEAASAPLPIPASIGGNSPY